MIILPGAKGIFRKVGIPEIPLTVTPDLWYRPEYIYDTNSNLVTVTASPVDYWPPYNNAATNAFTIVNDTGGGGGGTTAPIKQDPTANYGGLYLGAGTLSNNIQQLNTKVNDNPIEFSRVIGSPGPTYRTDVVCMGNRNAVYFDGTGGYLKVDTDRTAQFSTAHKPWTIGTALCIVNTPITETVLITIGNAALNTVYYSICADSLNIYIKSNLGNYTVVSNYSLDTPYRIVIHKFYRSAPSSTSTTNRVYVNGIIAGKLSFTPTNFPDGISFNWQFKLFNTALFHLGDFFYWLGPSVLYVPWADQPLTFYNYFNTKYGASN